MFLGLPGDIDFSGTVDEADLAEFIKHYGTATDADWESGDFNEDGVTSLADLLLLKQHFGESYSSSPAPTAVPEPSTLFLTLIAVIGLVVFGWRSELIRFIG